MVLPGCGSPCSSHRSVWMQWLLLCPSASPARHYLVAAACNAPFLNSQRASLGQRSPLKSLLVFLDQLGSVLSGAPGSVSFLLDALLYFSPSAKESVKWFLLLNWTSPLPRVTFLEAMVVLCPASQDYFPGLVHQKESAVASRTAVAVPATAT